MKCVKGSKMIRLYLSGHPSKRNSHLQNYWNDSV